MTRTGHASGGTGSASLGIGIGCIGSSSSSSAPAIVGEPVFEKDLEGIKDDELSCLKRAHLAKQLPHICG